MLQTMLRLVPVGAQFQGESVMSHGQVVPFFFEVQIGQVVVGIHHARIDAGSLAISLNGQVDLSLPAMDETEVVVAFGAMVIELNPPAQHRNGVVKLVKAVINGAEVDVGSGA